MINITIGLDGIPSEKKVLLGNQWENKDEEIFFNLPHEFDDYHKYMIAVIKQDGGNKTVVLPINDNIFVVSSAITYLSGKWYMYVMCRQNEINIESENIDIGALDGEHVFIADGFVGIVNTTLIDKSSVDNIPLDTNLEIVYEDLLKLKDELIAKINEPHDYNNAINKPSINNIELIGNKTLEQLGIQPQGEYLTEETDPTVPSWAKQPSKPQYTAEEVGALPKDTLIPKYKSGDNITIDENYVINAEVPKKFSEDNPSGYLTDEVILQLATDNKKIIEAINELNEKVQSLLDLNILTY